MLRPDGEPGVYGVVEVRSPAVFVVPVTEADEVVLVAVDRYSLGGLSWEVPAGGTDGEETLAAAGRELREETGLAARSLIDLGPVYSLNGVAHAPGRVVLATGLHPVGGAEQEAEGITSVRDGADPRAAGPHRGRRDHRQRVAGCPAARPGAAGPGALSRAGRASPLVGARCGRVAFQSLEPVLEQSGALGVLVQRDVALTEDPEQGVVQPADGAGRVSVVHPRGDGGLVGLAQDLTQLDQRGDAELEQEAGDPAVVVGPGPASLRVLPGEEGRQLTGVEAAGRRRSAPR